MGWLFRILSLKVSSRKMERLSAYKIEGDVYELENIINSDARIFTTLRDIVSVLAKDKTNCIMVGYGESLTDTKWLNPPLYRTVGARKYIDATPITKAIKSKIKNKYIVFLVDFIICLVILYLMSLIADLVGWELRK